MFENKIIKLRKLSTNDYSTYHNWRNDIEVMKTTSPQLDIYTLEETEQFISVIASQANAKGYMIEHKESGQTVGIVSLINIDYKNRSAECILDIGARDMWGKGIGTSAMSLILGFAFYELNLHRVYLQVFSFNERAIKLYEKMGFTHDGKFREAIYRDGRWHDTVIMSILKKEYLNKEQSDL
ncbi:MULTISPECIES: GNAT family N-acetyltransferase [Bacilli]|jgi:RimJ/RimL family protein N-acetyltransferase|uniref:N-acetyltransferase n=1 Tax=Jeotgalibaca ciconiae TaxID=2496265 RepID=A0A3S9H8R6_9LACT|nr:GNAT family protein [Jeotgalibaca ciconiae]AZP03749.1 N-acetyltransferase [Jeotgalibaca ciconiae]EEU7573066.1 GNAT family N-acetyltransferase [Listeria innocua]EEU7573219.1 GNAT family N-acetyltransferase [Listeria innocua]HCJ4368721.1 GNAT family N-acetyltransferase [Listeria innocua]